MLTCPSCGRERDERFHKCHGCDRYWVVRDPEPPPPPPHILMYHLPVLWDATRLCAGGFEKADTILYPCLTTLEEFRVMQNAPLAREQRELVWVCMRALERIKGFFETQDVADLNGGWRALVPAASALLGIAPPRPRDAADSYSTTDVVDISPEVDE